MTRNRIERVESLAQDVRYAVRTLWNSPLFTIVAVQREGDAAPTPAVRSNPKQLVSVRTRFPDARISSGRVSPIKLGELNNPQMRVAALVTARLYLNVLVIAKNEKGTVLVNFRYQSDEITVDDPAARQ